MKASDKYPTPPTVGASVIIPVDTFEEMKRELDELSPKEPEKVWPQNGDSVSMTFHDGEVITSPWGDSVCDNILLRRGKYFQTEAEAIAADEWLTSPITQARRRIEGLDGYAPMGACYAAFSGIDAALEATYLVANYGGLSFVTEEQTLAAISTHEADIRLVLTGES